ncbi:trifunctional purine biosynthetic protein adenosine-3 [Onthophagus taurus]|uniref:trifunctional purine biosynthetic protein adenosine-3 n=1 Tax=Onthophagus taurus TaxID=166361 RepID=UPI0039BDD84E
MSSNVLIIGSGGREHAITWKLSQSNHLKNIFVAPGSFAIGNEPKVKIINIDIKNFELISNWCVTNDINLVIIGPEDPLANGIADTLTLKGIKVFGPKKDGARIESDKNWAKSFFDRYNIPTARWKSFEHADEAKNYINTSTFPALVVKASGLAAGKGVIVASNKKEACEAVDEILTSQKFGKAGQIIVVEELLEGEEISVLAFSDGKCVKAMLPAQDHKRIFDGDKGPNTGGMGAYCPCPLLSDDDLKIVEEIVLKRTLMGFKQEKIDYKGVLYAGLMLTRDGPKVLEYNCRFGDPETEVILPLLDTDLFEIMMSCCNESLSTQKINWKQNLTAVGVVMASRGYPETSSKGQIIKNVDKVTSKPENVVFHCGTTLNDGNLVTNGGRVLICVTLTPSLQLSSIKALKCCKMIQFDGAQYRSDIAHKGIARSILERGKMTYKESGVDITAGNDLITHIKPSAKSTDRVGVMGGLGGFGGLFDLKASGYNDPILVSGTDGVGTKLKIAQEIGIHNTIGIDLVAMCVNDILANGAEPLFFLDYFACGVLDVKVAKEVISGIADGCKLAGCSLLGGETAEMPDMYPPGEYDLAGFAVGAVEKTNFLPKVNEIQPGDLVIGLPSSGVHSNGFSLVRKVMKIANVNYKDIAPFSSNKKSFGEELLTPTKIYVKGLIKAASSGKLKAFAHITGGGLLENIPRVLPKQLGVTLDAKNWKIPEVFTWLATLGGINEFELLRTFNCGIGGVVIIDKTHKNEILNLLSEYDPTIIGQIRNKENKPQVFVENFTQTMEINMRKYIPQTINQIGTKKKVGVLISGSGTNLQALIDATFDDSMHVGAEIVLVISNKPDVEGLKRAERANIPIKVLKHVDYPTRELFDEAMHKELVKNDVEIVCLAGFMRILSGWFTKQWRGKLINVHPALLPSFKGIHAQRQALEAGVCVTGCSVHFVDENVDTGAIITQEAVPIQINDTEEILTERIKKAEHKAFPRALKLLAAEKVRLGNDNKVIWI